MPQGHWLPFDPETDELHECVPLERRVYAQCESRAILELSGNELRLRLAETGELGSIWVSTVVPGEPQGILDAIRILASAPSVQLAYSDMQIAFKVDPIV
jgi:hypothetical protein